MSVAATTSVEIHTCPQDVPSLPAWFGEVTLLAHHLTRRGVLDALCDQVPLSRGRMGHYEVIDFLAVLFGYAISGERTLAAFFERVAPFAGPFMALFGREHLPHRCTLSRFLAAVDTSCLSALRALFEQECFARGFSHERVGGMSGRRGQRLLVIDVDATRQAARKPGPDQESGVSHAAAWVRGGLRPGYIGLRRQQVHVQERLPPAQSSSPPAGADSARLRRAERAHARAPLGRRKMLPDKTSTAIRSCGRAGRRLLTLTTTGTIVYAGLVGTTE